MSYGVHRTLHDKIDWSQAVNPRPMTLHNLSTSNQVCIIKPFLGTVGGEESLGHTVLSNKM